MATQAFTANMDTMSKLCDDALMSPTGLTVKFTVDRLGSLEACHTRARSTQNTFTSLRARSRRLNPEEKASAYHTKRGPYDGLVCRREPLPHNEGWCVRFLHATNIWDDVEITGGDGEPLGDLHEIRTLTAKLFGDFAHFTIYDYDRLEELKPGAFYDPSTNMDLKREDCDGQGNVFAKSAMRPLARPPVDLTARNVDLLDALTPGDLFGEDEEGG